MIISRSCSGESCVASVSRDDWLCSARTKPCGTKEKRCEGRLLHWSPSDAAVEGSKKAVPASHPGLCARFVKETALQKRGALLPDIDMVPQSRQQLGACCICFARAAYDMCPDCCRTRLMPNPNCCRLLQIDCAVRQENLKIAGEPLMLQLPLSPSYALTVHKVQATLCVLEWCLCV